MYICTLHVHILSHTCTFVHYMYNMYIFSHTQIHVHVHVHVHVSVSVSVSVVLYIHVIHIDIIKVFTTLFRKDQQFKCLVVYLHNFHIIILPIASLLSYNIIIYLPYDIKL